ncbi:ROK family protein [Fictibacillus barbaricus]|uniref:ROK family protein n=2 Tax=Fictibacillus barbaricus TaxID=182136 RepID=A0ABS2ZGZ7_9BACL|nr:ROK family protein [Fictibacillus barbaricus]MBN3546647.1 ROK family protein [Fictibacillus barbaricus]GGB42654.1 N-acylmannosamine kinase [Fictibacillus barbaricus]
MYVMGIDIGGTSIKGAVYNEHKRVSSIKNRTTEVAHGKEGILKGLLEVIEELMHDFPETASIGIGTAGRVNTDSGEIVYSTPNLPGWQGTNVPKEIQQIVPLPVMVDNDANTALIGEIWAQQKSYHSAVLLTLGTGVGGAAFLNGKLVRGHQWNGGEFGHSIFIPDGRPCNCGMNGCLEQYISGSALTREAQESGFTITHGREIFQIAETNSSASKIVQQYVKHVALALYNIQTTLDPEVIIIGGGVIDSKTHWWQLLLERIEGFPISIYVQPAVLGNEAGMAGAAKLCLEEKHQKGVTT